MKTTYRSGRWASLLAGMLAALLGVAGQAGAAESVRIEGHLAHPTRVLARQKPAQNTAARATTLGQLGFKTVEEFKSVKGLVTLDLANPAAIVAAAARSEEAQGKELLRAIDALRRSGLFDYVEPDYIVRANAVPTDAAFADGTLWGLRNTGQAGGVSGIDVGAVAAWDLTTGSAGVVVAVIDTGIRYTHQDLQAQMWRNPGEVAGNGIDDDGNGYIDDVHGINAITRTGDPFDDNDHGTHVAGTIGASANSGGPIVGVAWQVRLMACKFLNAAGSGAVSDAIKCVDYAVQKGARIMNNSWGGGGFSQSLYDSIVAARNAQSLFVAAAGNDGLDSDVSPAYPASYAVDNVIAVAAVDRTGARASFSNYGRNTVHLGAPGVDIYSSTAESDVSYASFNGTSMASPHVAGVAALVAAYHPGISVTELRQRLLSGVVSTPGLVNTITGGRVNAYNSLVIAADGILELNFQPSNGSPVDRASTAIVRVTVNDLAPVNNAVVTATVLGGGAIGFLNNGSGPDAVAGDNIYSQEVSIPAAATSLSLTVTVTAPGKTPVTTTVAYPFVVRPPNDAFANRVSIPANGGTVSGSNTNATREANEPLHFGNNGGKSVWWSWIAPAGGSATVTTTGSSFDTILAVYVGGAVNALTEIASDDDSGGGLNSRVVFTAQAGVEYQIAVDGFSGSSGAITLNVSSGGVGGDALAEAVDAAGASFTSGGGAPWFAQGLVTFDGSDAAQSGDISDSGESWMETTATGPGTVRFWSRISSEEGFDYLEFYVDGALQPGRISGEVNWAEQTHVLSAGTHQLRWRYVKDGSVSDGADAAWVDALRLPGQDHGLSEALDAPQFSFAIGVGPHWFGQSDISHDGVDAAQSGDISDSGECWMQTTVSGPGTVRFWSRISSEEGYDYLEFFIDGELQPGSISGEVDWIEQVHTLPAGAHELRWRYSKDGSVSDGADAAWVDQLRFIPGTVGDASAWYVHSSIRRPWGGDSDEQLFDRVFGAGGWSSDTFEDSAVTNLFNEGARVVFMDGSDQGALAMNFFLQQNLATISNWVARGGSLFLNAAPNVGEGMNLGFGISLTYPNAGSGRGVASLPAHPVFNGPYSPVGTAWNGNSFGHATVQGPGLSALIQRDQSTDIVLGEKRHGQGHILFGGMTQVIFHTPQLEAENLRANLFAYLNAVAPINTNTPPLITSQPRSQTVGPGSTFSLNVAARSASPLTYQWRFNGADIPGATGTNITIVNAEPGHAGIYTVRVTNARGSVVSQPATITIMSGQLYMGLTIHGRIGAEYRIDYQTTAGGLWTPLTSLFLPESPYLFIDSVPATGPARFYRAVLIE